MKLQVSTGEFNFCPASRCLDTSESASTGYPMETGTSLGPQILNL